MAKRKRGKSIAQQPTTLRAQLVAADIITRERAAQGDEFFRSDKTIVDSFDLIANPPQVKDRLQRWLERGKITEAMRNIGEDFTHRFVLTHLDQLRAQAYHRVNNYGYRPNALPGSEACRDWVDKQMQRLGGRDTARGSVVWCVLGLGYSVAEWAERYGWNGKTVHRKWGQHYLISALAILADERDHPLWMHIKRSTKIVLDTRNFSGAAL